MLTIDLFIRYVQVGVVNDETTSIGHQSRLHHVHAAKLKQLCSIPVIIKKLDYGVSPCDTASEECENCR
jgi:hypothetical protein